MTPGSRDKDRHLLCCPETLYLLKGKWHICFPSPKKVHFGNFQLTGESREPSCLLPFAAGACDESPDLPPQTSY